MHKAQETKNLYDFKGNGELIPAHRHCNGGGWVADTAYVEDTVYIGKDSSVFGCATVKDKAVITERAEVSGYAIVKDSACIKGSAVIRGTCTVKDHAEISGNVFIASHIEIGEHAVLDGEYCVFNELDCLECPALLDENYGASQSNKCLYCLEKSNGKRNTLHDSRRTTVRSWCPEDGGVNQNIDAETGAPQESGTDNP